MNDFKNYGQIGYYRDDTGVYSFQLGESTPMSADTSVDDQYFNLGDVAGLQIPVLLNVGNSRVLIKGSNNVLPDEIKVMFGTNRLLPELIDKQHRILYGKGLHVYREVFENKKLYRDWNNQPTIENWLGDWASIGIQDTPDDYIEKVIKDNYYFEDYFIKWRMYKGRRIGGIPVGGLEHLENRRCRLATRKSIDIFSGDFTDSDFNQVVVGNWGMSIERSMQVYKRLKLQYADQFDTAVSYHKHHTPGEIYGYNKFYYGIKDWLTATNRNPQYVNSYLDKALSAAVHVIIPWEWVESIENKLQDYCKHNQDLAADGKSSDEYLKPNGIEVGTSYHIGLRDQYIKAEMRKMTNWLTGVKNVGKTYTTYSWQTEKGTAQWKIEPVDTRYKEYISTLTDYDKRADEVITSSIGIDSSISNISKDGVISKSGADVYYNYLIYLHTNLPSAERITTQAINQAIMVNFPALYRQGFRVGLYNDVPARQEDVSPQNRMQNTVNQTAQGLQNTQNELKEVKSLLHQLITKLN